MTLSPLQKIARLVAIGQQARVDTGALPADPTAARVLALPYRTGISAEDHAAVNRRYVLANPAPNPDGSPFSLWPIQTEALLEFERQNGLFGPIGVGWGKTGLLQLCFQHCFATLGLERMALFVPAGLVHQLVANMLPRMRRQVRLSFEVHVVAGRTPEARNLIARRGRPGLYILSYSMASATGEKGPEAVSDQFARLLDTIAPEVVGLDECHNVKNRRSGRAQRIFKFLHDRMPLGVAVSGTITAKEIEDYWHLALWCLREQLPMPTTQSELREWGLCLNSKSTPSNAQLATMGWLRDWALQKLPGDQKLQQAGQPGLRAAYRVRLVSAPGVVATGDQEIEASLILTNRKPAREAGEELKKHIENIERAGITPGGDVIEHAIHGYKWLYELTSGFYNELYWETPERLAQRTKVSESEAEELLRMALDHHQAGQAYAKELRTWFQYHKVEGLDTPFWVGAEMERHGPAKVGDALYEAWREWKGLELPGLPERQSRCVRVDDYKIEEAADWACEVGKGVVWTANPEIGEWLHEVLLARGLPHAHCPAGKEGDRRIDDPSNMMCIAAIGNASGGHGTGKNLQRMSKQLFLQWPAAAVQAEQTLGRLHRNGQTEDVLTWLMMASDWDQMLLASTLTNALYIQQTTGNRQRLIYCNWLELPKVFPSDVLRERGFDNRRQGIGIDAELRGIFSEQAP